MKQTSLSALTLSGGLLFGFSALAGAQTQTGTARQNRQIPTQSRRSSAVNQTTNARQNAASRAANLRYRVNTYFDPFTVYSLYPGGYVTTQGGYVVNGTAYPSYNSYNDSLGAVTVSPPVSNLPAYYPGVINASGQPVIGAYGTLYAPPGESYLPAGIVPPPPIQTPVTGSDSNNPNSPNGSADPNAPGTDTSGKPDDYYLNRTPQSGTNGSALLPVRGAMRDRLNRTASHLTQTWSKNSLAYLSQHVDAQGRIAVYLGGKYQYSLKGSEYLTLTKRALRRNPTTNFVMDAPQRLKNNIYLLTGRHSYRDAQGSEKTVGVAYVLEERKGRLVITQTGAFV